MPRFTITSGAAAITAVVATLALSGCGNDAGRGSASPPPLPAQNQSLHVLPLDPYQVSDDEVERWNYAELLLQGECAASRGFALDVPWRDLEELGSPSRDTVGRKIFNVELARQWGYLSAPSVEPTMDDWLAFGESLSSITPEQSTVLDSCLAEARKALPLEDLMPAVNTAYGLSSMSYEEAKSSPKVKDAAAAWHECMITAGVSDLPEAPWDMPSESIRSARPTGEAVSGTSASEREIEIAVQDAECQVSTGFDVAFYQAQWDGEVQVLTKNYDQLVQLQADFAAYSAKVDKVIAEHLPSHG